MALKMISCTVVFAVLLFVVLPTSCTAHEKTGIQCSDKIKVRGKVTHQLEFSDKDMLSFQQDVLEDIDITNKRGAFKERATGLRGVLLTRLLDSAGISVEKPKEYSELAIVLTATDGYKNVYSWCELYNTEVGKHVYVITEMNGIKLTEMKDKILVMSLSDIHSGRRHLKCLQKIDVQRIH